MQVSPQATTTNNYKKWSSHRMTHSNRIGIHRFAVWAEIVLFAFGVSTAYFGQKNDWQLFFAISAFAFILFAILRLSEAQPQLKELLVREDLAARISTSALHGGLTDYFDMQRSTEQERRNKETKTEIASAKGLWLCANSGASYLDPGIYRHWPAVEKRLKDGVEFRVVLLDPYSAEKGFRNKLNVDGEYFDSKINLPNLIKLYNGYPSLDIRFVRYGMHATVFATEKVLFFDPYHVSVIDNRIENRSICLKVKPVDSTEGTGLHRRFKGHLDTLWRAGMSFEEWLEESKKMLPNELPPVKQRQYTR